MIEQILTVPVDDDITFTFKSIGEIREGDEYTGYRVALTADFPPMAVPLKLDITTGDKITPREIQYDYKLMLEDRHIQVMAYNLATILAEKLETVISRSDQNTRPRDYYDVYILTKLQAENIDFPALGAALMATASKRGSDSILQDYRAIVEAVRNSEIMRRQWDNYRKDFDYASTISFDEVCDAVASTMDSSLSSKLSSCASKRLRAGTFIDFFVREYVLRQPKCLNSRHKLNEQLQTWLCPHFQSPVNAWVVVNDTGKLLSRHTLCCSGFFDSQTDWRKIEVKIIISFVHKLTTLYL